MKRFQFKTSKPSARPAGKLHVRVEYELDAQFISELIDTGFLTYARVMRIASGKEDLFTTLCDEVEAHNEKVNKEKDSK
jgi:hypothetical protein